MNSLYWEARRDHISQYAGQGITASEAAKLAGLCVETIRQYAKIYGLEFGRPTSLRTLAKRERDKQIAARNAKLRDLAVEGKTRHECAEALALNYSVVCSLGKKLGLSFRKEWRGEKGPSDAERAVVMEGMYRAGKTLQQIGDVFGVSRERVRQVLSKYRGVFYKDGGQHQRSLKAKERRLAALDAKCLAERGCTTSQYRELRKLRTPTRAFSCQKKNALTRGVVWNLKLWDWWQIWQQSGHWEERGRAADAYVMCRFGDAGPYEVGNVYIATLRHNSRVQPNNPYRKSHPDFDKAMASKAKATERQRNVACRHRVNVGLPRGVTFHRGKFIAQASIDGKNRYLGSFDQSDVAHAAYLAAISRHPSQAAERAA